MKKISVLLLFLLLAGCCSDLPRLKLPEDLMQKPVPLQKI